LAATRLFAILPNADAARAYSGFDVVLEDEGLPVAIREVEEDGPLSEVSVYAEAEPDRIALLLRGVLERCGIGGEIRQERLPEIDWVAHSLEGLKPVRAGRFLVHGAHDRERRRPQDLAIEIEAGQAFGTGHHGTTAGCLEMLDRLVRAERPRSALDLGTGSAVLAIALAKLARIPVLATDIDPVAVRVAAENAELNGVLSFVAARRANGFATPAIGLAAPFDLIVANILARPLMRLAPDFARHVAPGGSVVLSGILVRQRWPVLAAFAGQRFRHVRTTLREGWATIHLKR
jgi:ribosomal protein L11 methyltransferase